MSVAIDPDNPALFDRKRQPAVLQRQRRLAEQFAAPAVQCGDIGMIVSRDLFEIVDRRDDLAGNGMTLGRHPQQNFQQLDDRRAV